ncbi:MAG: Rod binding domain-containing protein [Limisphaerales bacterium]|jgi:Rod binding domain-containing protein
MNVHSTPSLANPVGHDLEAVRKMPQAEAIKTISREFEAIFLREILRNSQKTVIESGLTKQDGATGIYQDMMVEQLANGMKESGGFGLAESLERQLNNQFVTAAPGTKNSTSEPK